MIISPINPAYIFFAGALLLPLIKGSLRKVFLLALPLLALVLCINLPHGSYEGINLFGFHQSTLRIDKLSFVFALIFHIAAFLNSLYGLHEKDTVQHVSGWLYAGAAIGAVFAGDLITLFVFWEITAIASVFLIWARRSEKAYHAGMRYLIIQVTSGVLLLGGAVLYMLHTNGDLSFNHIGLETTAGKIICLAFGIKAAFPLLHTWLKDAYPEATPMGTVMLSAFTTKLAIYSLARGFAGTDLLVLIGVIMVIFPVFHAVIENDLRRVLAYSLNSQLGFMVIGVGIGTELAINGVAAHAFVHIIYKSLLFMSMGAVLYRVGHCNASSLGGLYKSMPWTTAFCVVGALSAFPYFGGFVSKSMIMSATAKAGYMIPWLVLVFGSAAAFLLSGLKILYFAFFAENKNIEVKEAPSNMLAAMLLTSALCIGIGIFYGPLYDLLPYKVKYQPYTFDHILTQLQLMLFTALGFTLAICYGLYPKPQACLNVDIDWLFRCPGANIAKRIMKIATGTESAVSRSYHGLSAKCNALFLSLMGPDSRYSRTQSAGSMTFIAAALLGFILFFYYF